MTKNSLLTQLKKAISPSEYTLLLEDRLSHISPYNRRTILEIMEHTEAGDTSLPLSEIQALKGILDSYLSRYLPDDPSTWKWILLSCLYLSFIREEPMHPQKLVHYKKTVTNGKTSYYCPLKNMEKDTVCSFCVCENMKKRIL